MMQYHVCTIGGWLYPVSVKDEKEISQGKALKSPPLQSLLKPICIDMSQTNNMEIHSAVQEHPSDYMIVPTSHSVTLSESNWETLSSRDVYTSLETMADLPSIEDLICFCQKCRSERCPTHALSSFTLICYRGLEAHRTLGNYLVPMFVDCGSVLNAQQLFYKLSYRSDCSWTCLIRGYTEAGDVHHVVKLHQVMLDYGVLHTKYTFVALLTACVELKLIEKGRKIHAEVAMESLEANVFVGNTLINMYVTFSSLVEAEDVLYSLPIRDVISWTTLMSGYAEQGLPEEAFRCLEKMQLDGVTPNAASYVCALKTCGCLGAAIEGREIHTETVFRGYDEDLLVGNHLLDMYVKSALLAEAQRVLDVMPVYDVVSWTTLISGYAEHGPNEQALNTMERMQQKGVCPNTFTFVCGLKACCSMGDLHKGQCLHTDITKMGFEKELFVGNVLIDLYAKQRLLEESWNVFYQLPKQDVVSYTALLTGFLEEGLSEDVLVYMDQMKERGVSPNVLTLMCGVKACGDLGDLAKGRELHSEIASKGLEGDLIANTTLMDMYARCGSLTETTFLFNTSYVQDAVSWSIMIAGSVDYEEYNNALELFGQMKEQGWMPDLGILVSILKACGNMGFIDIGKRVHAQICETQELDSNMSGALIDMYGKCGNMVDAQEVFDEMQANDLVTWSALITGYAREGECQLAFDLFDKMMCEGIQPDRVAFLNIMSVCSHVGLVDRARSYFEIMTKRYVMAPTIKHCTCLVDLLGRAGHLHEAVDVAERMPFGGSPVLWITVLAACQKWKDVAVGRLAFDRIVALDEKDSGAYIAMSNIYVHAKMWEDAKKIETVRICMQASQESAKSWVQIGSLAHELLQEG